MHALTRHADDEYSRDARNARQARNVATHMAVAPVADAS
jgi:hypothetical protein